MCVRVNACPHMFMCMGFYDISLHVLLGFRKINNENEAGEVMKKEESDKK